jgi:hypothetical protein
MDRFKHRPQPASIPFAIFLNPLLVVWSGASARFDRAVYHVWLPIVNIFLQFSFASQPHNYHPFFQPE